MAKRKKIKISWRTIKGLLVFLFVVSFIAVVLKAGGFFLSTSDYFRIKEVRIDPILNFISEKDFSDLKGQNIFQIDLAILQKKLSYKYPQVAQLKIIKNFPDRIAVVAVKRFPFAQAHFKNKTVVFDEEGVVLSISSQRFEQLPLVAGLSFENQKPLLGLPLKNENLGVAKKIMTALRSEEAFSQVRVLKIDLSNLSRISLELSNNLKIFVDEDKIEERLRVLSLLLLRGEVDIAQTKYVDLRFQEPIIAKK